MPAPLTYRAPVFTSILFTKRFALQWSFKLLFFCNHRILFLPFENSSLFYFFIKTINVHCLKNSSKTEEYKELGKVSPCRMGPLLTVTGRSPVASLWPEGDPLGERKRRGFLWSSNFENLTYIIFPTWRSQRTLAFKGSQNRGSKKCWHNKQCCKKYPELDRFFQLCYYFLGEQGIHIAPPKGYGRLHAHKLFIDFPFSKRCHQQILSIPLPFVDLIHKQN